jgi:hypothetical protein
MQLQEQGLLDEKQVQHLFQTFGTLDPSGAMEFNIDTWEQQSIWNRAKHGVATCSNHIEGIHRFLNKATSQLMLLTRRLRKVIGCITARYNTAKRFKHTQGTRLLKKISQKQQSLGIQRCEECTDDKCGWKAYFTGIMQCKFPCVHEVGSEKVVFFHPGEEVPPHYPVPDCLEPNDYIGKWKIPSSQQVSTISQNSLEEEWYRDSESVSAFITVLATEIRNMCKKHIIHPHLIVTLGACYLDFLCGGDDTQETRSIFRLEWWLKAKSGDIQIW